jgi:hypothetical protein
MAIWEHDIYYPLFLLVAFRRRGGNPGSLSGRSKKAYGKGNV